MGESIVFKIKCRTYYSFLKYCNLFLTIIIPDIATDRDEEAAKLNETRETSIWMQGCMGPYCPSHNGSLTMYSSSFPASAVDWYAISGLNIHPPFTMKYSSSNEVNPAVRKLPVSTSKVNNLGSLMLFDEHYPPTSLS